MRRIVFEETMDGICIDRIIRDYEYNMPTKHVHDEYEIYYLLEGERYYFIENQTYLVKEGSIVFINKGQIHKTGVAGKSYHDRILIELKAEPFQTFLLSSCGISLSDFFSSNYGVIKLDNNGQHYVKSLLLGMADELHQKQPHYTAMAMMKLCSLLVYALRRTTHDNTEQVSNLAKTAKHKKVSEVASFIMANSTEVKSLDDLAKRFFISKCYLSRIFKEVTSFTVSEYININRIQKAQQMLLETDLSITEISASLGYESITYFEKVFSNFTETSPLKYRKKYKKTNQPMRDKKTEPEGVATKS
ncbi:helix-turn-helix domain-containing protein [Anaerocolumna sedimenticola]|uniref:Helix-turn-helix domain-containing protein n=1 Tax=Anaerocolumna sedimenticola TaxID=2696063 RepID=A0A6P1TG82_9FIRM|nr:AraC family transcriptional regulator [Anaerocolumna sedimenticola]QHQ59423.1 helix-turn-helix domain-containing protein [Anaerocolumna sedimenticola]